ncbi:MAG: putative toxin-antitoxin system toxin component, PIN family [SAR202 cluster bacterium]|nr:putative toxin-antitoxin system toxin component, PIN family [SAR202 cluster bacterium]
MSTGAERVRAVLDTNVFVSALNFGGPPGRILAATARGDFDLFVSKFILDELHRVLTLRFGWEVARADEVVDMFKSIGILVEPRGRVRVVKGGHDDNRVIDCAVAAKAHYLVTGDRRHLLPIGVFRGVAVVSPTDFLAALSRDFTASHPEVPSE